MRKYIILSLVFFCGCSTIPNQDQWFCHVRPVFVQPSNVDPFWTEEDLKLGQLKAQLAFEPAGLSLKFLEPHVVDDVYLSRCDSVTKILKFVDMSRLYEKKGELAVFYVGYLNLNGEQMGISYAPYGLIRNGIIIAFDTHGEVLPHEIGHYFGLLHPWEDDIEDTTHESEDDCSTFEESVNIMSYCDEMKYGFYSTMALTDGQRNKVRETIKSGVRSRILR